MTKVTKKGMVLSWNIECKMSALMRERLNLPDDHPAASRAITLLMLILDWDYSESVFIAESIKEEL